ncbi:transcriptional activator protein Pur-beta isoform X4 [Maniola jurtina]|uniref:transcriptional activator protein Pur-beta isoform X4 n=1 Tax=Maniola jurtina TaxID=191418 RepID=UPI001E689F5F|nr:transcriptional activator protein Pur-beta isoform X4 [Maniola jurtina]
MFLPTPEGELAGALPARVADDNARRAALAGGAAGAGHDRVPRRADGPAGRLRHRRRRVRARDHVIIATAHIGVVPSSSATPSSRCSFLHLKENSRGRFLRVSQTITRGGPRTQVALPAQGMIEFRDALTDLLDDFGTDDGGFKGELPEGRHLRVDNKNFYFDIGQNNRGIYMKVSEVVPSLQVKSNFRTAITVPEKCWTRFRDILADYCDKMSRAHSDSAEHHQGGSGSGGPRAGSAQPARDVEPFAAGARI